METPTVRLLTLCRWFCSDRALNLEGDSTLITPTRNTKTITIIIIITNAQINYELN